MPIVVHAATLPPFGAELLARCRSLPSSAASDALDRSGAMGGAIKPLRPGLRLCGRARTVAPVRGDNSAIHAAIGLLEPGDVLVVAGGGDVDVALIGSVVVAGAAVRGCAGMVIDGAVRDLAELRSGALPIFAAGSTPRGPQKGGGGSIDSVIACAGIAVRPGDLLIGDDDGVTAVPFQQIDRALRHAAEAEVRERAMIARLAAGESYPLVLGVAATVPAGDA